MARAETGTAVFMSAQNAPATRKTGRDAGGTRAVLHVHRRGLRTCGVVERLADRVVSARWRRFRLGKRTEKARAEIKEFVPSRTERSRLYGVGSDSR